MPRPQFSTSPAGTHKPPPIRGRLRICYGKPHIRPGAAPCTPSCPVSHSPSAAKEVEAHHPTGGCATWRHGTATSWATAAELAVRTMRGEADMQDDARRTRGIAWLALLLFTGGLLIPFVLFVALT